MSDALTREELLTENFRRVAAEKRVELLEHHIETLNLKIQRLQEVLTSSRGQCARLIDDNKRLRAEREKRFFDTRPDPVKAFLDGREEGFGSPGALRWDEGKETP